MRERLLAWWTILRVALEERLTYRGDFALGTLMRFLPIVTQIFLWWAVFGALTAEQGESPSVTGDRQAASAATIVGYNYQDMVAYFLLTMVARAFSSMPGLASGIAGQIRKGEIKKFLIQPVDMLGFSFLQRVAHKLAYYSVAAAPFALVFFLCRGFFVNGWPPVENLAAFFATLIMAFLLGFFLEAAIGLIGFWFLEVDSLLFVYMLLSFFLSGHMFPLDMLPAPWASLVDVLPLKYLAYYPAAVFLEKVRGQELVIGLWIEAAWVLFFIVASRVAWSRGVRRYSAFGG